MRRKTSWYFLSLNMIFFVLLVSVTAAGSGCLRATTISEPTQPSISQDSEPVSGRSPFTAYVTAPAEVKTCSPLQIEFTVTNHGETGVYLLEWYTPLEGILGDIFQVTYQGKELDYLGPMVMRADPLLENYLYFEPGESRSASVDLASAYPFHQEGEYEIKFRSPRISDTAVSQEQFPVSVEETRPVEIPSDPVTVRVLPAEDGVDCRLGEEPPESPPESRPFITLSGIVREASPSVRVIWLAEAVEGFESIVLTEETTLLDQDGNPLEINQVQGGMTIQAFGLPGEPGALLAEEVILTR